MKKVSLLLLSLLMFLFVGCGDDTVTENADAATLSNPALESMGLKSEEQSYASIINSEPQSIDISRASDRYSSTILGKMFDALVAVEVQEDGTEIIVPSAAESWTISEDGTVYEFKIRDHKWSDGQAVVADDFKFSMMRTLNPDTAAPYAYLLYSIKGAEAYNAGEAEAKDVAISVLDEKTLQIELTRPLPYFLQLCYFKTMYPQRADYVEKYGEQYGTEADTIIGNGAFTLTEWVHNSVVKLDRNAHYWDADRIFLNKLTYNVVKDDNVRYNLLLSKQIDTAGVLDPEWQKKFEDMSLEKKDIYELGTNYTFFNTQDPLFKNPKVRLAFSLATDRVELNNMIFRGKFEPAMGFVSKGIKIGEKDYLEEVPGALEAYKDVDPKALLQEGLAELGMDTDISKLEVTYFTSGAGGSFAKEYTDFLQQMYKKNLGFELKLDIVDWPTFSSRVDKLDYQFAGQAWGADYNDPTTFLDIFASTSNVANTGWVNEKYDMLLHEAELTTDTDERIELYREAEEILLTEGPVAPTLYRKYVQYIWPHLKEYREPVLAPYNFKDAYIEGAR